jgi:hypothetical protein
MLSQAFPLHSTPHWLLEVDKEVRAVGVAAVKEVAVEVEEKEWGLQGVQKNK